MKPIARPPRGAPVPRSNSPQAPERPLDRAAPPPLNHRESAR
jgi:hypothetical protein